MIRARPVRRLLVAAMHDCDPRVPEGIALLRARQWFAAHEVIEAAWIVAEGGRRTFLQGLIHVAVSFEHLRRGNPRGALSQWRKAQPKLGVCGAPSYGIDVAVWRAEISRFFAQIGLEQRAREAAGGTPASALPGEDTWPVPPVA